MHRVYELVTQDIGRAKRDAKKALDAAESGAARSLTAAGLARILPIHIGSHSDVEAARKHQQAVNCWGIGRDAIVRANVGKADDIAKLLEEKATRLSV